MGKGAAKFGYKSGTLPVVRSILKKPIKPIVRPANPNVGYAEGVQHPRGTSREQPLPEIKTVEQLIQDTVKEPKEIPNLQTLTKIQKDKVTKAALRREYYIESLKAEESKLELNEQREHKRKEAEEIRRSEQVHEVSEATKLTLPTISNLLNGPLMRQRTQEEEDILQAKRKVNRLNNQLTGDSNRAVNLLELYYQAEDFIVTEEDLAKALDKTFDKTLSLIDADPDKSYRSHNHTFANALFGKINNKPSLAEVEEQLSGEKLEFEQQVSNAINKTTRDGVNKLQK